MLRYRKSWAQRFIISPPPLSKSAHAFYTPYLFASAGKDGYLYVAYPGSSTLPERAGLGSLRWLADTGSLCGSRRLWLYRVSSSCMCGTYWALACGLCGNMWPALLFLRPQTMNAPRRSARITRGTVMPMAILAPGDMALALALALELAKLELVGEGDAVVVADVLLDEVLVVDELVELELELEMEASACEESSWRISVSVACHRT